jgi:hypothetical protein
MRTKTGIVLLAAGVFCLAPGQGAQAYRGGGASSVHAGGFSGGAGSVHYAGASHYGPATGFTHVGGATYAGAGGVSHESNATHVGAGGAEHYSGETHAGYGGAEHYGEASGYHAGAGYAPRPVNYGSIQHYDATARVATPYGISGHAVETPAGYGAAVAHGPEGGTAAAYRGPYSSGAAVRGPAGYGAGAVQGPAGGVAAGYRGPYSAGAVAALPAGYTSAAWRGETYYHSGYSFYRPTMYAGAVSYVPVAPPVGWFFPSLPPDAVQTVVDNTPYYVADGAYYQSATQDGQQGYAVAAPPSGAAAPAQEPAAAAAPDPFVLLKNMSDYMGSQKQIKMTVNETFDEVAAAGQKVQLSNQRRIELKRPDKAAVDVRGPGIERRIVYADGTFTAVDLLKNVYTTLPMQGPLDAVMDTLAKQYGMAQPVEDLLYSDINARLAPNIQAGQFLGRELVADYNCYHLAFSQPGVSWQIWIEEGNRPIPRRVVISYDNAPGRPQYALVVSNWETPLSMPDSDFKVQLPQGAVSTSMTTLTGQPPAKKPQ